MRSIADEEEWVVLKGIKGGNRRIRGRSGGKIGKFTLFFAISELAQKR